MSEKDDPVGILHANLLFDFYSGLLTARQREIFSMHSMDDMSLVEIAQAVGISPQAVQDILKRTRTKLEKYEGQLGLVKRHLFHREVAEEIRKITGDSKKDILIRTLVESLL